MARATVSSTVSGLASVLPPPDPPARPPAVAEPPEAVGTTGGLRRQILADAEAAQRREAGASALPLSPDDGAQPSSDPLVDPTQHRRGLAGAKVAAPSKEIVRQVFDWSGAADRSVARPGSLHAS